MSAAEKGAPEGAAKRKPMVMIIGVVVLIVALLVGGSVMLLGKQGPASGKEKEKGSKSASKTSKADHGSHDSEKSSEEPVEVGEKLQLQEFLVNLAGSSDSYLKIEVALGLKKLVKKEKMEEEVAPIRDAIISVLCDRKRAQFATAEGREQLKADLLAKIQEEMANDEVVKVYLTSLTTQ